MKLYDSIFEPEMTVSEYLEAANVLRERRSGKKKFREYLEESIETRAERLEDINVSIGEDEVIFARIWFKEADQKALQPILEARQWKDGPKDYVYRTDPKSPVNQFRAEVCVTRRKWKNSVPQWTWYDDGNRKDLHKFTKEPTQMARQLARDVLGIPDNVFLEHIEVFALRLAPQLLGT